MNIEGIGNQLLINHEVVTRDFPFSIRYDGQLIYEVVRVKDGYPLFWPEHLERMRKSLELHGQNGQKIVDEIEATIRVFIKHANFKNNNVKIIVGNFENDAYEYMAYHVSSFYPDAHFYKNGAKVVSYRHERLNPNAKTINNDLAKTVAQIRKETTAYEVALINSEGIVTEGSRSNIFFLKDHCVYVSQGDKILKGITMLKVMTLFEALDICYKEGPVYKEQLKDYDACFMTSTSNNVLPIDTIDDQQFDSSHNEIVMALMRAFEDLMKEDQLNFIRNYEEEI